MNTSKLYYILAVAACVAIGCSKNSDSPTGSPGGGGPTGGNPATIDNVNAANNDLSAGVDAQNALHVSYYDFHLNTLKYATNKSGAWVATTIDPGTDSIVINGANDLSVDGNGKIHIVYTATIGSTRNKEGVYYATNASGAWVISKVREYVALSLVGIVATANGKVHIAMSDFDNMRLHYTNNVSGSWSAPIIIGSFWAGVRPRMALDATGNVYIAYEHGGEGTLHLAVVNTSGAMAGNAIIDGVSGSGHSTGWSPAIAVGSTSGTVYISYWDYDNKLLKLYAGGTVSRIDSCYNWPDSDIAIDQNGKVHIAYAKGSTMKLMHASNASGVWTTETLTPSLSSRSTEIALESTGKIDFVYCALAANTLNFFSK